MADTALIDSLIKGSSGYSLMLNKESGHLVPDNTIWGSLNIVMPCLANSKHADEIGNDAGLFIKQQIKKAGLITTEPKGDGLQNGELRVLADHDDNEKVVLYIGIAAPDVTQTEKMLNAIQNALSIKNIHELGLNPDDDKFAPELKKLSNSIACEPKISSLPDVRHFVEKANDGPKRG